jgi:hypothetical protein
LQGNPVFGQDLYNEKKKVLGQPRRKTSKINGLGSHLKVMVLTQYYLDVHQEQKTNKSMTQK